MAEFVAVLDEATRVYAPARFSEHTLVSVKNSVVVGVRVDDGPTRSATNINPEGRLHERSWGSMPDELAFSTQAFFRAIYEMRNVGWGRNYDCHGYASFALRHTEDMTWPEGSKPPSLFTAEMPMAPLLHQKYSGYAMFDRATNAGVHSIIALPKKHGIIPECLAVQGVGGPLVVAETKQVEKLYGKSYFYRVHRISR